MGEREVSRGINVESIIPYDSETPPADFNVYYNTTDTGIIELLLKHEELEHWRPLISHLNPTSFLSPLSFEWWANEIELQYEKDLAFIVKRNVKLMRILDTLRDWCLMRLSDALDGHRSKMITEQRKIYSVEQEEKKKRRWGLF